MINEADKIKKEIIAKSQQIGFSLTGFAASGQLIDEIAKLRQWLEMGYHGSMKWMESNIYKRENPGNILENAKTIIVTATNYYLPEENEMGTESGIISVYARHRDYHEVLKKKMKLLAEFIKSNYGAESKIYVDTGPVMDKVWAKKAGIGWQGKNSLILTREYGSYVFISLIITDLEIPADEENSQTCGNCRICIDACPTKALVADSVLDSTKCLAYWTIEAKPEESFPEEINTELSSRLFGCDICQQVCPWNKGKKIADFPEFKSENTKASYLCDEVLSMDEDSFRLNFRKTPIQRLKLAGLKRNAEELKIYFLKKR